MSKGKFVVVDGLDGVGKGVFLDTFVEEAKKDGKRVYDVHDFWAKNDFHPSLDELSDIDVFVTSESTFVGVGKYIREELTARNGRAYSPQVVAQAYAVDRQILYENLVLPLLDKGVDVYQSRSLSTSLVYQKQSALDLGETFSAGEILAIPGNAFCYAHPMDFLLIPTIKNVEDLMERLKNRDKDDNCDFENLDFQLKIKGAYDSEDFRDIFRNVGVDVRELDASVTVEYSEKLAREFYAQELR